MHDLAPWLVNRVQMTTDGHKEYLEANGERIWQSDRLRHIGQALREPERQRSACGSALQPRSVHGRAQDGHFGETGSEAHFDQHYRTAEPHDADEHAPLHQITERLLEETGESRTRRSPLLHVIRFRSRSPDLAGHPCDGSRGVRPRLEF